jgi:hypothetical protein
MPWFVMISPLLIIEGQGTANREQQTANSYSLFPAFQGSRGAIA